MFVLSDLHCNVFAEALKIVQVLTKFSLPRVDFDRTPIRVAAAVDVNKPNLQQMMWSAFLVSGKLLCLCEVSRFGFFHVVVALVSYRFLQSIMPPCNWLLSLIFYHCQLAIAMSIPKSNVTIYLKKV